MIYIILYFNILKFADSNETTPLLKKDKKPEPVLKVHTLCELEFLKYCEINQGLCRLINENYQVTEIVEKTILSFLSENFAPKNVNLKRARRIANLWNYPTKYFSVKKRCFCNFYEPEHRTHFYFLIMIEMISHTMTFEKILQKGIETQHNDINELIANLYTMLHCEYLASDYYERVEYIYRSVLLEVLKSMDKRIGQNQVIKNKAVQDAIFYEFGAICVNSLKINYINETKADHPVFTFEYSPEKILNGFHSSLSSNLSQTTIAPDIIEKI